MSSYTGPDEFPIKVIPETPLWSENFAAMFNDNESNLSVMYSCGRWLGDPTMWREFVMVSFADGTFLYHRGYGRNGDETGPGGCLSKYTILEPGKKVHLHFDGPMTETTSDFLIHHSAQNNPPEKACRMDLTFDSAIPVWNMKGDSAEASTMAGGIHIDHIGSAQGTVEYNGKTHHLNGYAVRDHSRGIRDMSHYGAHFWVNGTFPGGRSFYVYAMRAFGTDELGMSNAAIDQDGVLYPATVKQVELIDSIDYAGKGHKVILGSELGDMEVNITEVTNIFPYSMVVPFDTALGKLDHRPRAVLYDEFVKMTWNGVEGRGWSERGWADQALAQQ
jgi:hypothetical protein